jgi:hypothetical protein
MRGGTLEKIQKRFGVNCEAIIDHFANANSYKKDDAQQKKFMEDLLLFVTKTYIHIFIVES